MENNVSKQSASDSEDMDLGEGEGQAVPIRSIATQSAPHSPAVSAGDITELPVILAKPKLTRLQTTRVFKCPIPVLNKDTENSETFDAELLINPKIQQRVLSAHRMKKSSDTPKLVHCKSLNVSIEKGRNLTPKTTGKEFDNRSEELKIKIEKRFGKFVEDLNEKDMEECFFIPNKERVQGRPPTSPRVLTERLSIRETKCKEPKGTPEKLTFTPELCKKSKKLAKKNSDEPRFESLHRNYKSRSSKDLTKVDVHTTEIMQTQITILQPTPQEPLCPIVNSRSKNMLRLGQFGETYSPNIRKSSHVQNYVKNVSMSQNSEKVLIDKFSKEFYGILEESDSEISYAHFMVILREMKFVLDGEKTEGEKEAVVKMWKEVSNGEWVGVEELLMFLMAIMRYKPHLFYKNSPNLIAEEESDRIHKKYLLFYSNRLSVINKSNKNQSFRHTYDFSFKPVINKNLSDEKFGKVEDRLIEKLNQNAIKKEKLKDQYLKIKENECTFQPKVASKFMKKSGKETQKATIAKEYLAIAEGNSDRNEALYSLAFVEKERKKNEEAKKKQERELDNCTFSPRVINRPKDTASPTIFGSDKAVQRLVKAREEKMLLKVVSDKGFPFQGEKKLPKIEMENKAKVGKMMENKQDDPEKQKKFKEWEMQKAKELKIQKEKEKYRLEILEKEKNDLKMKTLQEQEEKRKVRIEKIQNSERKAKEKAVKKKGKNRIFFDYVNKGGYEKSKCLTEDFEKDSQSLSALDGKSENFESLYVPRLEQAEKKNTVSEIKCKEQETANKLSEISETIETHQAANKSFIDSTSKDQETFGLDHLIESSEFHNSMPENSKEKSDFTSPDSKTSPADKNIIKKVESSAGFFS